MYIREHLGQDDSKALYTWLGSLATNGAGGTTGLLYRRNRYYDSETGRWTQEDPIGIAGGINVFGFAAGDPVNHSDPFGLCPQSITGRPCTTVHKVGTVLGAGTGALIGGAGGAVAGSFVLPVAGTVGGGAAGAVAGAAEGGVLGLAAANLAVEGAALVGATAQEMSKLRGWIRRLLVAGGIYAGGGLSEGQERSLRPEPPARPPAEEEEKRPKPDEEKLQ